MGEELAEGEGRGGEAPGDADSRATELADHLAQRRVLAADLIDVAHAQALEGNHPLHCIRHEGSDLGGGGARMLQRANPDWEPHFSALADPPRERCCDAKQRTRRGGSVVSLYRRSEGLAKTSIRTVAARPAVVGKFQVDGLRRTGRFELRLRARRRRLGLTALDRATQRPIEIRMRRLEVADDLEIDAALPATGRPARRARDAAARARASASRDRSRSASRRFA